jgi:hypothetical protein
MGIKIAGFELPINCLVSTARRQNPWFFSNIAHFIVAFGLNDG